MAKGYLVGVLLLVCLASTIDACRRRSSRRRSDGGCRYERRCYPMSICTGVYPHVHCPVQQNCFTQRVCTGGSAKRSASSDQEQLIHDISQPTLIFFKLDLNGDGLVDSTEWTQQLESKEAFHKVDLNGDGKVSRDELSEVPLKAILGEYVLEKKEAD